MRLAGLLLALIACVAGCKAKPPAEDMERQSRIAHTKAELARSEHAYAEWATWRSVARTHDHEICDAKGCFYPDEYTGYDAHAEDVSKPPADAGSGPGPLEVITDFHRQLRAHGIELLVVLVPLKSALLPERIAPVPAGLARPDLGQLRFGLALQRNGVDVLDLYDAFKAASRVDGPKVFRENDLHWASFGTSVAADAIAERVRKLPFFAAVSAEQGRILTTERKTWVTVPPSTKLSAPERLLTHEVVVTSQAHPSAYDRTSPVVLLGDSFSYFYSEATERAGLPHHLLRALGFKVDGYGVPGGAYHATRVKLSISRPGLTGVRLVIYEMSWPQVHAYDKWQKLDVFGARALDRPRNAE